MLSENLRKALATLLREVESKRGSVKKALAMDENESVAGNDETHEMPNS